MKAPARPRPPSHSAPDDDSSVRERSARERSYSPPPTSTGGSRERLDVKLRAAQAVLAKLSATDDRARLLHVAVMRRDEALLDGVLASLGIVPGNVPPGSR